MAQWRCLRSGPMPSVTLNEVRVFDAVVEVDWTAGSFTVDGEIARDGSTIARFGDGDRCVIDGRACRGFGMTGERPGHAMIRGEAFPWRREEWEG